MCEKLGYNMSQDCVKSIAYQTSFTKDCHFTYSCIGITNMAGRAILCVMILGGEKREITVEA